MEPLTSPPFAPGRSSKLAALAAAWLALTPAGACGEAPPTTAGGVAPSADRVEPIEVGARIPSVELRTVDGEPVSLDAVTGEHPVALVFYRGGW